MIAESGFRAVDLTVRPDGHVLPERVEDDLPRAVETLRRSGLTVPMITTAITDANDPLDAPRADDGEEGRVSRTTGWATGTFPPIDEPLAGAARR